MRISDNRYTQDRLRFDLAMRFMRHEARAQTICNWTGLAENRIRELYRSYVRSTSNDLTRLRGKSPEQAAFFTRTPRVQMDTSVLASLFTIFDVASTKVTATTNSRAPDLARGERLCQAFECYLMVVPSSQITFEHAVLLLKEIDRSVELQLHECSACCGLTIVDALACCSDVTCGRCAGLGVQPTLEESSSPKVRCFLVGDIEVRYVSDAKKVRLECTACKPGRCTHTAKVSAWFTILNALSVTEDPAKLRGRIVATLRRDYRNSLGAALAAARVIEVTKRDSSAGEKNAEPDEPLDLADRMAQVIQEVQDANPDQVILSDIVGPVTCDSHRIEKLLARLLTKAMTDDFTPGSVVVKAHHNEREFVISVSNAGQLMPGSRRAEKTRSFKPEIEFVDGKLRVRDPLEVCFEIARELNGELTVTSEEGRPCFVFRMPIEPA